MRKLINALIGLHPYCIFFKRLFSRHIVTSEETIQIAYRMLKVYNPFQQTLIYKAKMYLLNHDKWVETSILPVGGGYPVMKYGMI
jgi:hypothetical protein